MICDFSVIICAYTEKRWDELMAAIASVQQQSLPANEIILVIDHNAALLQRVREHLQDVTIIENSGLSGLSGARNSGIAAAMSPFIAFLDDDAIAPLDWLMELSRSFARTSVLGVGGPVLPLWSAGKPSWLPEEFYWVIGCTYRGMPATASMIRNPIGANMAFRREVFEAVGGFQSGIGRVGARPLGCEETELCIRARQFWPARGFLYQPRAAVFHHVSAARTRWSYFFSRCYAEGLSKALVSGLVGAQDSLASERAYTSKVLPRGVLHALIDGFAHRDWSGFARAWAMSSGLATTVAGYVIGNFQARTATLKGTIPTKDLPSTASKAA